MGIKQELERFAGRSDSRSPTSTKRRRRTTSPATRATTPERSLSPNGQSRGRGQRGNSWSSSAGANLTFSVVLCPGFLETAQQFYLSKAVSLAVCDTVESFGVRPQVKWPNDIYIDGRKVAGILIENDLAGNFLSRSVVGIGINVNQTEFDPALPNPTSLAVAAAGSWTGRKFLDPYFTKK